MLRTLQTIAIVFLVVGVASPAPRLKEAASRATYWPTKVGATRQYEADSGTEVVVVTAVEQSGGVTSVTSATIGADGRQKPNDKVEIRKDGIYMTEETGKPYDPPWCLLRFPIKAGDKWETETSRPDIGKLRSVQEVGEAKRIETPAGRFEAVPIASEDWIGGNQTGRQFVFWYAKEVGLVQIDGLRTLKAYSQGK